MVVSTSIARHLNFSSFSVARRLFSTMTDVEKRAMAEGLARKYSDVPDKYRFEKFAPHHFNLLMDLARGFYETESLTKATGSTIDNCRLSMEWLFSYSICANVAVTNQSWIVFHKETNKPIGFRMENAIYRDLKMAPFYFPTPPPWSPQEYSLITPLEEQFNVVWDIFPEEKVLWKGEVVFIDPAHRSSGVFHCLIDYNLDLPAIADATGSKYLVILCTSNKTKAWYSKLGFKVLNKGPKDGKVKNVKGEIVDLPDGEFWLMATDLRKTTPIDVFPFWKETKKCPYGNY